MAKYVIQLDEKSYVKNFSQIFDGKIFINLTTDSLENALLFNENLEDKFKERYPNARAIPVKIIAIEESKEDDLPFKPEVSD